MIKEEKSTDVYDEDSRPQTRLLTNNTRMSIESQGGGETEVPTNLFQRRARTPGATMGCRVVKRLSMQ